MPREVLLLGSPVAASLSPAMQNAAFAALGIEAGYVPADAVDARAAIERVRADDNVLGANVTIPLKESVIPFLDGLDATAARVGAVNTITKRGTALIGFNTDVDGFRRALEESRYEVIGRKVALIGAGGAARAVGYVLGPLVSQLLVVARRPEQARRVIDDLEIAHGQAVSIQELATAAQRVSVMVNATPTDVVSRESLRQGQRLFDLRSRRSEEGRAMLLHQGAASFEIWTGRPAPLEIMRAALRQAGQAVLA